MNHWLGMTIEYKVAEMPIIVSAEFGQLLAETASDIIQECVSDTSDHPLFSVVDFAVCQDSSGMYYPKLIELQGFPSLFGYQLLLSEAYQKIYDLQDYTPFLSGLTREDYVALLRQAIYGDANPSTTVLLEVDPHLQKTRPDFVALEKYIGLPAVNIRDVRKVGRNLVAPVHGVETRLTRIFNRAIIDELTDLGVQLSFDWNEDLDVEWAGHPKWYFEISKNSMINLKNPAVPRTITLSNVSDMPPNLGDYVLKPLYSFAGKGVVVGPTPKDIENIAYDQRSSWILQERVTFADCVPTPTGNNKVEIRIMLIWLPSSQKPLPCMTLARTGRGALMGSRYNTDPWTGSSGCLIVQN